MARSFNGSTAKIVGASVTPINFNYNNAFTACGWAKLADVSYNCLIGHLDTGSGYRGWELSRSNADSGKLDFFLVNSYPSKCIEKPSGVASWPSSYNGVWKHFGVTYSGSGISTGVKLFVGGIDLTSGDIYNTLGTNSTTNSIVPYIGQRNNGTIPIADGGSLQDIAIWNVALTLNEISALAKGRRPWMVRSSAIVAYWPLDGLMSPEPDLSGNANNGTLTATAYANGPPVMMFTPRWPVNDVFPSAGPSFIPAWAQQSNLPVIGGGTY